MDAQRLGGDLERRLGGEQLGHAGLHVDPLPGVGPPGGVVGHEAGRLQFGSHIGQLELDGLVLVDGSAERLALLGVPHGRIEGRLGYADRPGSHVDPTQLEGREGVLPTVAHPLVSAQHVGVGHAVVHVGHLDRL